MHWHESTTGVYEFPILNPPPTSHPIYLWIIPVDNLVCNCYFILELSWFPMFSFRCTWTWFSYTSVQFSRQSCLTLCDPMNRSTPGLPVHHQLPEFTQTHVHRVGDAIQPSHPPSSPSPPAPNPSQHQSLFQWVSSLHEVAKVLELQL